MEMWTRRCRLLTLEVLALVIIGIVMIASSSRVWAAYKFDDPLYYAWRQGMFALFGFGAMFLCSRIPIKRLQRHARSLFWISVVTLVLVLIPGIGVLRNGSRSGFGAGSFLIQPSEFFKLAIILYVSDFLSRRYRIKRFRRDLLLPFLWLGIGFGLILLQPDFGSGIVMACAVVVIILAADAPLSYFFRLGALALAALSALIVSAPYRMARIVSFLDPWQDPLGSGFQIIQSLFAIAPGGILGVGFDRSMQKHFYLPEPQTDFIFAIIAEEMGFIGCLGLIALFLALIYQGVKIALAQSDSFLCYTAIGITSLFAIQVMINLGVVVGLFPVTGITLPFISYGGSSLVVMMASMGLLISIANSAAQE